MKDIENYEGLYAVTEDGRVWSYKRKKFLAPRPNNKGYLRVGLCKKGEVTDFYIHRLVATAYVENSDPKVNTIVNHLDENPQNNCADNLAWTTYSGNACHGSAREKIAKARMKPVYCVELDLKFESVKAAAEHVGLHPNTVGLACRSGGSRTAAGYHFCFIKKEDSLKQK